MVRNASMVPSVCFSLFGMPDIIKLWLELSWEALGRLEIEPPLLTDTPDYRSKANNQGNAFAGFGDCPAPRAVDDTSQFDDEFTTQMVSHSMIEDTMSNASSPYRSRTNSETYKDFDYMSPDFSVSQVSMG